MFTSEILLTMGVLRLDNFLKILIVNEIEVTTLK
jgi:hypothetical protein